jgi:Glyoxalase-like domain
MKAMLQLDHIIFAVNDCEAAAERLRRGHGLIARPGGVHAEGTKNWIVTLRSGQYLELLAIDDADRLKSSTGWGEALMTRLREGDYFMGWAVRTTDIDAVSARVGIVAETGTIEMSGVAQPGWRFIDPTGEGFDWMPMFVQYLGDLEARAERWRQRYSEAASPAEPERFEWIEVAGDEAKLREWLGGETLPVRLVDGTPGVRAVCISTPRGEVTLI